MTTINTMEQRCAYTLGYLQAIADEHYIKIDLSGVELMRPSVRETIRDILGILKERQKDVEEALDDDPYDEDERHIWERYQDSLESLEKLLETF